MEPAAGRRSDEVFQGTGVTAALAAGGTLLAVMIALSWYGAVTLPADARVPVHWGFGWGNYRSKQFGLITWPVAGAVSYLLLGVFGASLSHGHREDLVAIVLMVVIMGMMAALQAGALAAARRTVGGGAMGA